MCFPACSSLLAFSSVSVATTDSSPQRHHRPSKSGLIHAEGNFIYTHNDQVPPGPHRTFAEEFRLYLQCTNSSSCPWDLSIQTCAFYSVYYERGNALEDGFSMFAPPLERTSWTEQTFHALNNGNNGRCWFRCTFRAWMNNLLQKSVRADNRCA